MLSNKTSKIFRKVISAVLSFALIIGVCVMPAAANAQTLNYLYQKEYTFDKGSSTRYAGETAADIFGDERQISHALFSRGENEDNGYLKASNLYQSTSAKYDTFLFNDADGLFDLMSSSEYTLTMRVMVKSAQKGFIKNSITYPLSNQYTTLKLVYGVPAQIAENSASADTEIGRVVRVGTQATSFTAIQGSEKTYAVGEWVDLTYTFTTPASFGSNGSALALSFESYNGVQIFIDDVKIDKTLNITVNAKGGTISKTKFPHKIGDKVNIENPKYQAGYDFEGWYLDTNLTTPFTDTVITKENCEVTLYAKYSNTHFSFESYIPYNSTYSFATPFVSTVEDETAPHGKKVFQYRYVPETYNQHYVPSSGYKGQNWDSRRTQQDNNLSLTRLEANTTYIITYKYRLEPGSGNCNFELYTDDNNVWGGTSPVTRYAATLSPDGTDQWRTGRTVLVTDALSSNSNMLYLKFYAAAHKDAVAYIDDIIITKPIGESQATFNANGGAFDDGATEKTVNIMGGDQLSDYEIPVREGYAFDGWYFDRACKEYVGKVVNSNAYYNTLYAGWSIGNDFENYKYQTETGVSVTQDNAYIGKKAVKITNSQSTAKHNILIAPLRSEQRYIVTFNYKLISANTDITFNLATMNENKGDVKTLSGSFTVSKNQPKDIYYMGAIICDAEFLNSASNLLTLQVGSSASGDYTVYIDSVNIAEIDYDKGAVIVNDNFGGRNKVVTDAKGSKVRLNEVKLTAKKFAGWCTDGGYTSTYVDTYTYSDTPSSLYAYYIEGEGFENYSNTVTNAAVVQDTADVENKYLKVSGNTTVNLGTVTAGTKYGVDFSYTATGNVTLNIGGQSVTLQSSSAFKETTVVVTPATSSLSMSVSFANTATLCIDDVVVYPIDSRFSTVTFNFNKSGMENVVTIGVKGTKLPLPAEGSGDTFYGWYTNSSTTTIFSSLVYPSSDTTLYAKWASSSPVTYANFEDLGENLSSLMSYSGTAAVLKDVTYSTNYQFNGSYSVQVKPQSAAVGSSKAARFPVMNSGGMIALESGKTYVISFVYRGNARTFKFYRGTTSSAQCDTSTTYKLTDDISLPAASQWTRYSVKITTSSDLGTRKYLYFVATSSNGNLYIDNVSLTRVDANRNVTDVYNERRNKTYTFVGTYGQPIDFDQIGVNDYYEIGGFYKEADIKTPVTSNTHASEAYTKIYVGEQIKPLDFENYEFENDNSRYVRGDDVFVTTEDSYDTQRSLKYSYTYREGYMNDCRHVTNLGYVYDDNVYAVSFYYKLKDSIGDVDIKFRTANRYDYWAYATEYNDATYRVYSSEKGDGWKKATVYFKTAFAGAATSCLYISFNPQVEGKTELLIDAVNVKKLSSDTAVVAFLGQDGRAGTYKVAQEGASVNAVTLPPVSQFAKFIGWYTNPEYTTSYSPSALSSGITYVYSKWQDNAEGFDAYSYKSNDANVFSKENTVANGYLTFASLGNQGIFRLGKIKDNTSYKVTFEYKTNGTDAKIGFATANGTSINENRTDYTDEGNFITVSGANADNNWHTATLYLTSSFAYTVPNDSNANIKDNPNAVYGDFLYVTTDAENGEEISLDNFAFTEVDVLNEKGAMVLTEEAKETVDKQAMRFVFSYKSVDYTSIAVGGETFTLIERGIIFKNARNTATGVYTDNGIMVKPINIKNSKDKGHATIKKTYKFNVNWDYDGKNDEVCFSGYMTDFAEQDTRLTGARAYVKLRSASGNVYTFYSSDKKTTVKEGEDVNSEITDVDVHTIADAPLNNFRIVHPKTMPYIYGMQIENLIDYAKNTHNITLDSVTEKTTAKRNEIIIGDTKRQESANITVDDENKYVIAVVNGKLIIKGGSDLATMQGVIDFIDYLKMKDGLDCGIDLKNGYYREGTVKVDSDTYALTFADEFNASQMDLSVWKSYSGRVEGAWNGRDSMVGGKTDFRNPGGSGYTTYLGRDVEQGIFMQDGKAVLTAARIGENGINNIASEMSTQYTMNYRFGMLEIKVKLSQPLSYTGFWTGRGGGATNFNRDVQGFGTEIDILENFGNLNHYVPNVHYWWTAVGSKDTGHSSLDSDKYSGRGQTYVPDSDETSLYDDYHIFTYLWTGEKATFAFDGVKFFEYNNSDISTFNGTTSFLIISQCMCAVGMGNDNWNKATDAQRAVDYYETKLDYVRIYQQSGLGSEMNWAKGINR